VNDSEIPPSNFRYERLRTSDLKSPLYENPFPRVAADRVKQAAVTEAFLHAWNNYDRYCFGRDSLQPLSKHCGKVIDGGLTIVDSLSTLLVMNLTKEFEKARRWVLTQFRPQGGWSLFEFIIRIMGGLVSAVDLSGDPALNKTAIALGNALLRAIEPTGGFFGSFHMSTPAQNTFQVHVGSGRPCIAESGTFQVEFLALARLTGDERFVKTALNVYHNIWKDHSGGLIGSHIGACEDSYYEYVIKSYLMTGGRSKEMLRRYLMIAKDIRERLLFRTIHRGLYGIGMSSGSDIDPMMEHLATFAGGMFAIGSVKGNRNATDDMELGARLATTYATVYREFKAGLSPEHVRYNTKNKGNPKDFWTGDYGSYILRPESVESVYLLWKFTGLQKYRDYAWEMFKAINKSCRVEHGFAAVDNVNDDHPHHRDEMESFFLAETHKYLYLVFSDSDIISPVDWVFNTEAHPVRIWRQEDVAKFAAHLEFQEFTDGQAHR
jgi:mannosyl-oligosaccharide alpha-1,2-mannosidase